MGAPPSFPLSPPSSGAAMGVAYSSSSLSMPPAPPPFPTPAVTPPPAPMTSARVTRGGTPAPSLTGRTEAALAAMEAEPPTTALPAPPAAVLSSIAPTSPLAHSLSAAIDAVELPDGGGTRTDEVMPDEAAYDAHVKAIYDEYLATRERCGESIGSLTLDRFRAKLDANRQQLIVKYNCRSARFSVYVKDGKAAIKATPVR
jgi:hypothetical protein